MKIKWWNWSMFLVILRYFNYVKRVITCSYINKFLKHFITLIDSNKINRLKLLIFYLKNKSMLNYNNDKLQWWILTKINTCQNLFFMKILVNWRKNLALIVIKNEFLHSA